MSENVILNKSFTFSVRIVKLYQYLSKNNKEYVLSKQILRCGTTIGANVEEAEGGYSKQEFSATMSIAYKEARETHYWLRLLNERGYLDKQLFDSLLADCDELLRILYSTINTSKK